MVSTQYPRFRWLPLVLVLFLPFEFVGSTIIHLDWCGETPVTSYQSRKAKEGDTIVFHMPVQHERNVLIINDEVLYSEQVVLGGSGAHYTFTIKDIGSDVSFINQYADIDNSLTISVVPENEEIIYLTSTPCGEGRISNHAADDDASNDFMKIAE
jgi:hypothetical protein